MVDDVKGLNRTALALLNDSLAVAFVTFLGYLAAYRFETGYLGYFNIPSEFIEIDISNVLNTVVQILAFAIPMFLTINGLSAFGIFQTEDIKNNPVRRQIHKYIFVFFVIFISFLFNRDKWETPLIISLLYIAWEVFWFTCVYNKGSFRERIELEERQESPVQQRLIMNRIPIQLLLVFLALCSLSFVEMYGRMLAREQEFFLKVTDRQSLLVIRIYKDKLIAKPFILSGAILKDQVRIISVDSISSRKLLIDSQYINGITVERAACTQCK